MTKKQLQNLNLTNMKKEVKKLSSQTEHTVMIGDSEYKFKIDDNFLKTKQYQLLDDMVEFFNQANKNQGLLEVATPYTTLLFVKHFTSIEVSDNVDEAVEMLDVLIDLDLLGYILNLMPEQEVLKVYELINVTVERMTENIESSEEEVERLSEVVENKELKEMLSDGKTKKSE